MATEKKESYTQKLINQLNYKFESDEKHKAVYEDIIFEIKSFAQDQRALFEAKETVDEGLMSFGKYKDKKIEDIYKIDRSYVKWLQKNNKYLSTKGKEIVDRLMK